MAPRRLPRSHLAARPRDSPFGRARAASRPGMPVQCRLTTTSTAEPPAGPGAWRGHETLRPSAVFVLGCNGRLTPSPRPIRLANGAHHAAKAGGRETRGGRSREGLSIVGVSRVSPPRAAAPRRSRCRAYDRRRHGTAKRAAIVSMGAHVYLARRAGYAEGSAGRHRRSPRRGGGHLCSTSSRSPCLSEDVGRPLSATCASRQFVPLAKELEEGMPIASKHRRSSSSNGAEKKTSRAWRLDREQGELARARSRRPSSRAGSPPAPVVPPLTALGAPRVSRRPRLGLELDRWRRTRGGVHRRSLGRIPLC